MPQNGVTATIQPSHMDLEIGVEWLILLAVLSVGLYFFHYLPSVRRQHLRKITHCLVKIGGLSDEQWSRSLINEAQYLAAKQEVDIQLFNQLVKNEVRMHEAVLRRKKSQSLYTDDYGITRDDSWRTMVDYFVRSVLFPLNTSELYDLEEEFLSSPTHHLFSDTGNRDIVEYWIDFIDCLVDPEPIVSNPDFDEVMTGHEYEEYIAGVIRGLGWSARVTPGSGDHGADVIAEKDGMRIAVQCKLYSSPVGNKSVQEAFSAKSFYDCDDACVVTNSSFTLAAKKAASKLEVALLHHEDMPAYFTD